MNKTVIAMLLLGLVVVAMAGDAREKSAKLEKMRLKKAKMMAKKEKMHMDKVKKGMREGAVPNIKRGEAISAKDAFREKYELMKEQAKTGAISAQQFKEQMRRLKEEVKGRNSGKSPASRNKRSTKEATRKIKKDAIKSKFAEKKRRDAKP